MLLLYLLIIWPNFCFLIVEISISIFGKYNVEKNRRDELEIKVQRDKDRKNNLDIKTNADKETKVNNLDIKTDKNREIKVDSPSKRLNVNIEIDRKTRVYKRIRVDEGIKTDNLSIGTKNKVCIAFFFLCYTVFLLTTFLKLVIVFLLSFLLSLFLINLWLKLKLLFLVTLINWKASFLIYSIDKI